MWYYQDGFIISKCSDKVLDVKGGELEDKAYICQYDRKKVINAHNQRWGYHKGYIYSLANTSMVLDLRNHSTADGTRIILSNKKFGYDNTQQLWDLVPAGETRAEREVLFETDFD